MVELEDFKYGGTNITAFRLVNPDSELVQSVTVKDVQSVTVKDVQSVTVKDVQSVTPTVKDVLVVKIHSHNR